MTGDIGWNNLSGEEFRRALAEVAKAMDDCEVREEDRIMQIPFSWYRAMTGRWNPTRIHDEPYEPMVVLR